MAESKSQPLLIISLQGLVHSKVSICSKLIDGLWSELKLTLHSVVKVRSGLLGPIGNVAKQTGNHQESNPGCWCTCQQCYHCATPLCITVWSSAAIIFQLKLLLTIFYLDAVALHPMAHVQDKAAIPTTKHTVPVHYSKHLTGKFWLWWPATGFMWLIFFPNVSMWLNHFSHLGTEWRWFHGPHYLLLYK